LTQLIVYTMKKVLKIALKVLVIIILLASVAGLGGWWYINSAFLSFENDYAENTDIKELTIDGKAGLPKYILLQENIL